MPDADSLTRLAALLNEAERVTILCGSGCQGAHAELLELGERLKAPMVHTMRGKEHVEWDNPYDVGMTGLIGFSSGYYAMLDCDALLVLGADFPYRQFYPEGKAARVAQVDIRGEQIGRRRAVDLAVVGDVRATSRALLPLLDGRHDGAHLARAREHYGQARKELDRLAEGKPGRDLIHPQQVAKAISDLAADGRGFHVRRRPADGLGGTLSCDERRAAAPRVVLARLDGQCHGAGDRRPGEQPRPSGRLSVGRRRIYHADGRSHQPEAARPAGEGGRIQ